MAQQECEELINHLRSALGLLQLEPDSQLRKDTLSICDNLANPYFRIAVFGPFNYGKSTLLNSILGNKTLPIDLIPTTGAAILVKYGDELRSKITFKGGREISESGIEVLKQYAILDSDRRMRDDVASIEVFCPHYFLKLGVELLDLPGTNDREEQDRLVRDQLLTADLIVQVLDARKLMTLGERENLRDWLLDRDIKTVVFVVNFLNLLEPEEQKQVYNRLLFVAESFRSDLPPGVSNIYRVDALPALRARLKGDGTAVQKTGLPMFESALQSIVAAHKEKIANRLPRVVAIASQVQQQLQTQAQAIASELAVAENKRQEKIELKQRAEKLIQRGFQASSSDFQSWLYLPKLLKRYQVELSLALQQGQFKTWELKFKPEILKYQKAITDWVYKACEFFEQQHPGELVISLPPAPQISVSPPPTPPKQESETDVAPVAIATGLGWFLGGPIGAAVVGGVTYFLNQNTGQTEENPQSSTAYLEELAQACNEAAKDYLTRFSNDTFSTLYQYEEIANQVMVFKQNQENLKNNNQQHYQLQLLNNLVANIEQELKIVSG